MSQQSKSDLCAPGLDDLAALAQAALEHLPDPYGQMAKSLAIQIAEFPSEDVLRDLEIENPFDLTGLYDGIPLTEKSSMDQPLGPDIIWLFRRPILEEWIERGNVGLGELVTHILVHELAHHFGWSDEQIAEVDEWWT